MAGKRQKQPSDLQGHRAKPETRALAPEGNAGRRIPAAPKDWHPVAKKAWRQFWSSSLPQVLDVQADDEAIRRWGFCLSEREKLEVLLAKEPTVRGSTGQQVRNPLFDVLKERNREIERFRELFGMSPLHRMRLGITWDQADEARGRMERRRATALEEPPVVEVGGAARDGDAIEVSA